MSGRKFILMASVATYCVSIMGTLILSVIGKIETSVFLATFSGLGTLVMYLAKAYYDDKERIYNKEVSNAS